MSKQFDKYWERTRKNRDGTGSSASPVPIVETIARRAWEAGRARGKLEMVGHHTGYMLQQRVAEEHYEIVEAVLATALVNTNELIAQELRSHIYSLVKSNV